MEKKSSAQLIKRILRTTLITSLLLIILIYLFTNKTIYSIIFLFATIISIAGFLIMIKVIDRILNKGKGQVLFFLTGFLKMSVIAATFFLASRISESAVLFYILGISMVVVSIMIEGVFQLFRSFSNGRT